MPIIGLTYTQSYFFFSLLVFFHLAIQIRLKKNATQIIMLQQSQTELPLTWACLNWIPLGNF